MAEGKDLLVKLFAEASSSSPGWSLHSSVQLQDWLEKFSKWLIGRTDCIAAEMSGLLEETSRVEQDLHNTYNSLRLLSNLQFVENRVQEEDEVSSSLELTRDVHAPDSVLESYESDILPRYKEAAFTAWSAYEQYGRGTSRSSSLIVSQRDHYRESLPYIIGSEDFEKSATCGVRENLIREASFHDNDFEKNDKSSKEKAVIASEAIESESSDVEKQGEPIVSAALDFKAMLEAALRGPYVTYDPFSLKHDKQNTGDCDFNSSGNLDGFPGSRSGDGDSMADASRFLAKGFLTEGASSSSLVKGGHIGHVFGESSNVPMQSSDSLLEQTLRVDIPTINTQISSKPYPIQEQSGKTALAGVPSDISLNSNPHITGQTRESKNIVPAEDQNKPSTETLHAPDFIARSKKEATPSSLFGHVHDGALDAFDLDLFRKHKDLNVHEGHGGGGLFDDDFDAVPDGLCGTMDLSVCDNLLTGEQHRDLAERENQYREDLISNAPLSDILSKISMEQPLAGMDSIHEDTVTQSTISGQNIGQASELDVESKKQSNEQSPRMIKQTDIAAPVLGSAVPKLSDSTIVAINDFESHSNSTNGQEDLKYLGDEAATVVESMENFMDSKQKLDLVSPSPDFVSSSAIIKSHQKNYFWEEVLSPQFENVLSIGESTYASSLQKEPPDTTNKTDQNVINDDISTREPQSLAAKVNKKASSSTAISVQNADSDTRGTLPKAKPEPPSVTFKGPRVTSLSRVLFMDEDEDQEDSLFGPLQDKFSRKTYTSGYLTSKLDSSGTFATGSNDVESSKPAKQNLFPKGPYGKSDGSLFDD